MAGGGETIIIKKKKGGHGHGHHGGSWKVAYADFVTAMMAFFMVMWILGLSDESKAQISGYFNDPFGYSKTSPLTRNIVKFPGVPVTTGGRIKKQEADVVKNDKLAVITVQSAIESKIQQALEKGAKSGEFQLAPGSLKELLEHIDVSVTEEGLRIEMMEDKGAVFFDTGSSTLRPEARSILKLLAPILRESGRKMRLEGHTDSRPFGAGAEFDNYDLSQARANALRRELMRHRIGLSQFEGVMGFADQKPKIPGNPNHPANRRVSILLPYAQERQAIDAVRADINPNLGSEARLRPTIDVTEEDAVNHPADAQREKMSNFEKWQKGYDH